PFFGQSTEATARKPREAPLAMWISPLLLGVAGLLFGLLPHLLGESLVGPVVSGLLGAAEPVPVHLVLWPGFNFALFLGVIAIAAGLALYASRVRVNRLLAPLGNLEEWGPESCYRRSLSGLLAVGSAQTRLLQSGYL